MLLPNCQALAKEVRRRQRDVQLDQRQHQGVHKVPFDDREERRVQREYSGIFVMGVVKEERSLTLP